MNLTQSLLDTELGQAVLVSKLSGKPAHVFDDVFAWNGKIMDRSTAIIALLKVYNHIPVSENVKLCAYKKYHHRFKPIENSDFFVGTDFVEDRDEDRQARFWFSGVCHAVRGDIIEISKETIKEILITLHS